jgi:hypothetical protein
LDTVVLPIGGFGGTLLNDDGGGVTEDEITGGGVELGTGGSVVFEIGGGSITVDEGTGGGSLDFCVSLEGSGGGSVTDGTTPVPLGETGGIVTSVELGSSTSGSFVVASVPFCSGGATLVITDTMSLTSDVRGSKGSFLVVSGAGVVVELSLTMPVGAIVIGVVVLVVVGGTTDTTVSVGRLVSVSVSEADSDGPERLGDPRTGPLVPVSPVSWLNGTSDVRVGSELVPLLAAAVGVGGTKTVLWMTTVVVPAAAGIGKSKLARLLTRSEKSDTSESSLLVDCEVASPDSLGTALSSEVIVALENCRLMCRGKYILLVDVSSCPATDTAATSAATRTEVVRILRSIGVRHALSRV